MSDASSVASAFSRVAAPACVLASLMALVSWLRPANVDVVTPSEEKKTISNVQLVDYCMVLRSWDVMLPTVL